MARWDSTPRGDRPTEHVSKGGDGGGHPFEMGENALGFEPGSNPQTETPGWPQSRHERWSWLRASIADVAASGHEPAAADIDALPASARPQARAAVAEAQRLFRAGEQEPARRAAREAFMTIEQEIHDAWRPPREDPDMDVVDAIRSW